MLLQFVYKIVKLLPVNVVLLLCLTFFAHLPPVPPLFFLSTVAFRLRARANNTNEATRHQQRLGI